MFDEVIARGVGGTISGQANDEGHAHGLLVHVVLRPHAMRAGHFAVVRGIDDDGVFVETEVAERVEHFADARIHLADVAVVSRECATEFGVCLRVPTALFGANEVAFKAGLERVWVAFGQGEGFGIVAVEVVPHGHEGRVRHKVGRPEDKGLVRRSLFPQVPHGFVCVVRILKIARRQVRGPPGGAAIAALIAAQGIPFPIGQGFSEIAQLQAVIESVLLRFIHKVHFADGAGLIPAFGKVMGDSAGIGRERVLQNAGAVRVGILRGDDGPARGHADRRLAIGAGKARARCGDAVDVRGLHFRVTVTPRRGGLVLVRAKKENVGGHWKSKK